MMRSIIRRSRIPKDLDSVTSIRRETETPEREVGLPHGSVDAVWRAVRHLYRSGIHPAIQLCIRRRGEIVLNRAIGHASGNGPDDPEDARKEPCTPDTLFNIFSASKAITAMVAHHLDEHGKIHINDPVCEYIPEYAKHGKHVITIHHVLEHRAGVPNLPPEAIDLDALGDDDRTAELLCEAEPLWRPGRILAYHAVTGGFIIGEIVRRVTGRGIRDYLREEILEPLGFRWTNYGVPPEHVDDVALSYNTGPPVLPPLSNLLERALSLPVDEVTEVSNDPRFLTAVLPAANTITTAEELSRFYQMLLNGGELDGVRVFDPRTIRRARCEQSYLEVDFTLGFPVRYGLGFMLGAQWLSLYGPDTEHAFGHLGFTNIVSWADPERELAATLMTSGKPVLYPEVVHLYEIVRQIAKRFPKDHRFVPGPTA